jgi:signal peptidase I
VRTFSVRTPPIDEPEAAELEPVDIIPSTPRRSRRKRLLIEFVVLTAIALLIAFFLRTFVAQAYYIPTDSMQPGLDVGDRIVLDKVSYVAHGPRRGDIVIFDSPLQSSSDDAALPVRLVRRGLDAVGLRQPDTDTLVKRVIALPGETVEASNGRVLIDGEPIDEPYLATGTVTASFGPKHVGDDEVWVMGDKRATSRDSRDFGAIPRDSITGRVGLKFWPPSELGRI